MRIVYLLLSPTFGMHQYTADLANRLAAVYPVSLVTTTGLPRDRYRADIQVCTPLTTGNTGFSLEGLHLGALQQVWQQVIALRPDVVHLTGPHLWNVILVRRFRQWGIPTLHTLHDLDPHRGTPFRALVSLWNALIIRSANHILVHGECYQERLRRRGVPARKVTYTPLLHLFLSYEKNLTLANLELNEMLPVAYEPFALFFGRLERYKGIDYLLTACAELASADGGSQARLVLAGPGDLAELWAGDTPPNVTVHNRLVGDEEAMALFRRCSLLVLPYVDATQSALIPAAYFFRKPVLVTRAGALAEYVEDGRTGYIVEPDHPPSLARVLAAALADPARLQQMGEAGQTWYRQRRTNETATLLSLYSRVAAEGRPRQRRSQPVEESLPETLKA
jgi:glycosyltransferase involved in cell wall biosynthesis